MKSYKNIDTRFLFTILPIIPILIILFITDSFYSDIESLKADYSKNINHLVTQKKITLSTIISNRIAHAKMQNHSIQLELLKSINSNYPDKKIVINEMSGENISTDFSKILTNVLNKDHERSKMYDVLDQDHIVFICNYKGIFELSDNHNSQSNSAVYKSWNSFISSTYNKEFTKRTINRILSIGYSRHLIESKLATLSEYNVTTYFDISSQNLLEDIINTGDIGVYQYFDILVPTYVSIYKSPDDVIIIRRINLFSIIEPYIFSIHRYDSMVEDYKHDMNKLIFLKIMACVTITIALLGSFFLALFSALEKIKEKR